jgi:hypothetical protein
MVVVVVIWAKTGAPLPARNAVELGRTAGLLRMGGIVAKLVLANTDKALADPGLRVSQGCLCPLEVPRLRGAKDVNPQAPHA